MNDFWIIVHPEVKEVGGRIAINIRHITTVREKTDSRFAIIDFADGTSLVTKESFVDVLKDLPSAKRHGRWEFVEDEDWAGGEYYRCSACGWGYSCEMYHEPDEFEHCPHCGAEMGPGKEEKGDS